MDATAGECCAWTHKGALFNHEVFNKEKGGEVCGVLISDETKGKESNFDKLREACCANEGKDSTGDCDSSSWPKG